MALPPYRPSDFAAAVPTANEPACTAVNKLVRMAQLTSETFAWMIGDDGEATQDFLDWVGTTASGLAAPTGLSATQDRTTDITVSWASASGATSYDLYRGSSGDTSAMTLLANGISGTSYVDTGAAQDVDVFYAVQARNSTQVSGFSSPVSGKRPSSSVGTDPVVEDFTASTSVPLKSVTVPTGKTQMEVQMWGAGGRGGGKYVAPAWTPIGSGGVPDNPGGGGASGSFYRLTAVTVAPGDVFVLAPGLASTDLAESQDTILYKTELYGGEYAIAYSGGDGTTGTSTYDGSGGSPADTDGLNELGSGSYDGVNSRPGNPGVDTTAGAGVVYAGRTAGAGGAGNTSTSSKVAGGPGRIRLIFT